MSENSFISSKERTLPEVLRSGRQADPDGVEVRISRQAVEEAAIELERLRAALERAKNELAAQDQEVIRLRRERGPYAAGSSADETTERICACIPVAPRPWKFCTDCGGQIPEETAGKPCTCDNCLGSSTPCRVDAGGKIGALWYCRKRAEKASGEVRALYNATVDDLNREQCAATGHEFRPIDSGGQCACIFCNARQVETAEQLSGSRSQTDDVSVLQGAGVPEKAPARQIPPGRMCNTHGNWNCSECCPPENGGEKHGS